MPLLGGISPLFLLLVNTLLLGSTTYLYQQHPDTFHTHLESIQFRLGLLSPESCTNFPPTEYLLRAQCILRGTPLIDGHNDFPFILRQQLKFEIYGQDFATLDVGSHTDITKIKKGQLGGQFWSVFVPCSEDLVPVNLTWGTGIDDPDWAVRDTLEQIDVTKRFVEAYPDHLTLCTTPRCVRRAHRSGKVASMIGIEGGHQTGNSIATLRQMFELGARYMTITHNCDNAYATAWISVPDSISHKETDLDAHIAADPGLTSYGVSLIHEMNRLGMFVDLSHVSANTMRHVLRVARAPVIFSHSGSFGVIPHGRNVPDDVLRAVKVNRGVVMVPFVSVFLNLENPDDANIDDVVDHIEHIAKVAGWENIGIGSDFDGTTFIAQGVDDTSLYPALVARMLGRGISEEHVRMVVGDNVLRAWEEVEQIAKVMQHQGERPVESAWEGRTWEPMNVDVPRLFNTS